MFKKYQHIERFNTEEVQDIEFGTCFIFPKIDGTNGSVWLENNPIECQIVDKYITQALCEKEFAKLNETGWNSKRIPELLNRIYYEFITEDCWHFIKEYKNPMIDFKLLNKYCTLKIKENLKTIF